MLSMARVTAVHPEDHSVDLVMVEDGSRYVAVQVLAATAGSDFGTFDLPAPSAAGDKWSLSTKRERDILAVTAMLGGSAVPVVLGFLFPQVNGVLFGDQNRRVMRHASDVYTSIDGDGNVEIAHPNGTYLRIGTSPDHEDLSGHDFDGNWAITKNVGRSTHLQVVVKAGGSQKAKLHIDPAGNVSLEHSGNLSINTTGTVGLVAGGAVTVQAPSVTLDAPQTTCTGALTVQGLLTYQAGMTGSGGSGASMTGNLTLTGNFTSTGTMTNNGKSVGSALRVTGVQGGSSVSGNPV